MWRVFCKLIGATASLSSGLNTQSNGQTERLIQDLETMLLGLDMDNPKSWSTWLPWTEYTEYPALVF